MTEDRTAPATAGRDTIQGTRYKRVMPIYTKTGDSGDTGLFGNRRVRKHHPRIEAYGTVDELNSVLGAVAAEPLPADLGERLRRIQTMLFEIGADLATEGGRKSVDRARQETAEIERWIDAAQAQLPPLRSFILPGGHREAAAFHVARTVCRRAERTVWTLVDGDPAVPREPAVYLNRLSDLLFVWARLTNQKHAIQDVPWVPAG